MTLLNTSAWYALFVVSLSCVTTSSWPFLQARAKVNVAVPVVQSAPKIHRVRPVRARRIYHRPPLVIAPAPSIWYAFAVPFFVQLGAVLGCLCASFLFFHIVG